MSWITRVCNVFRRGRLHREIEEELTTHIEEAIRHGRSAEEARRAFGGMLQYREQSLDTRLVPWLESLVADVGFGWRQLVKNRAVSVSAVLSLALATGAATGAFRLIDAMMLRPLPVAEPERLHFLEIESVSRDGRPSQQDDFSYPVFREYRGIMEDRADLLVVGYSMRQDVTFGADDETEKLYRQYVSGSIFGVFGLQPALGRLLTPDDDTEPGAHPVAVLSYDYWTRHFGRDPKVVGKTFRLRRTLYEIVGVAPKGFIGTEPGAIVDAFIPAAMNVEALDKAGWSWFRIWLRPKPGVTLEQIRQPLQAALLRERQEQTKHWIAGTPKEAIAAHLKAAVVIHPAALGVSDVQKQYRRPLSIMAVLAALVLLIACANVANLLTAQAVARAREMALRVSIGAGRWRLIQMVLVESALVAILASVLGALFAWYSVPFVVSMLTPADNPLRLVLDPDWRILAFLVALAVSVTFAFGLAPALRASSVRPISALKGGDDPHSHRRLMSSLIAAQVAFCVLVLFVAGLFITAFDRLSKQPLGFSPESVLTMETQATNGKQSPEIWSRVADHLRETPGVQSAGVAGWALMSGNRWTVNLQVAGRLSETAPLALDVSPGFFDTMRIGLVDGRDFRPGDRPPDLSNGQPVGGVGIVNEAFVRVYFARQNPVGRSVLVFIEKDAVAPVQIVGYVRDARYRNLRDPLLPTLYVPMTARANGTFVVRTAGDSMALATILKREVTQARSGFHVQNLQTQTALVRRHSIRERLLATLSIFFAMTALVLAGMGLYSVLNYSVIQRWREIGIRMALGARSGDVVRRVTGEVIAMLCLGSAAGIACGLACEQYVRALLFEVKGTDLRMLLAPAATLLMVALAAAVPPVMRAVRIDPAETLRSE